MGKIIANTFLMVMFVAFVFIIGLFVYRQYQSPYNWHIANTSPDKAYVAENPQFSVKVMPLFYEENGYVIAFSNDNFKRDRQTIMQYQNYTGTYTYMYFIDAESAMVVAKKYDTYAKCINSNWNGYRTYLHARREIKVY